jgi:hypothetical protein
MASRQEMLKKLHAAQSGNRRFLRVLVPATSTEEAETCHSVGEANGAAGEPDGRTTEQQSISAPSTAAPRRSTRLRKPRVIVSV